MSTLGDILKHSINNNILFKKYASSLIIFWTMKFNALLGVLDNRSLKGEKYMLKEIFTQQFEFELHVICIDSFVADKRNHLDYY